MPRNGLFLLLLVFVNGDGGKYSEKANTGRSFYPDEKSPIVHFGSVAEPFRMSRVNLLWEKARRAGLAEGKLERLYSKLKVQDKDELTMKKLKTEGGDKDGIKEAEVRRKFALLMEEFGLGGEVVHEKEVEPTKALFRDKKLTRLWEKAEKSGLNSEELTALQEEFRHHQRKVDEYHMLLEMAGEDDGKRLNDIQRELDMDVFDIRDTNEYHKKGKALKRDYERLHRLATNQPVESPFNEPKVAGLWKLALESKFEPEELASLRQELAHYETRLEKMHFLQAELKLVDERHGGKFGPDDDDKTEGRGIMDRKLEKHISHVSKLHETLEGRIIARRNEL